ncbi:MAG: heparinase II/III family protein [Chloroflexi bacterium]|nr:heparinase II/III family protein [Chloroflexota bacterium]
MPTSTATARSTPATPPQTTVAPWATAPAMDNLIDSFAWEYVDSKVDVVAGKLSGTSGDSWLGPVNFFARFKVQGDWGVLFSAENPTEAGGGITLIGSLSTGELARGQKRVELLVRPTRVGLSLRDGESANPSFSTSFRATAMGTHPVLEFRKRGQQFVILANGATLGEAEDPGIFSQGVLYLGIISAPGNRVTIDRLAMRVPEGQQANVRLDRPAFPSAAAPVPATAPSMPATLSLPTEQTVLATLRPGHPRLVALDADIQRLRTTIATDPAAGLYYERLRNQGAQMLSAAPVQRSVDSRGTILEISREVLNRAYTLGLLYWLDGDKKWADRATAELVNAARFTDWNPAQFLDVAEMSHALAVGYDWLYDVIPASSREEIRQAIVNKGLLAFQKAYGEKAWWTTSASNWNLVSNGGIAIAALAVADTDAQLSRQVLARALGSMPSGLAAYASDGGYPEGAGYWSYGTEYATVALAALESALGTDFGLGSLPGLSETGMYRVDVTGPSGVVFNYSDSGINVSWIGDEPTLFWLSRRYNQPLLAWAGRRAAAQGMGTGNFKPSRALDLLWYQAGGEPKELTGRPLDTFYRDKHVAMLRSSWADEKAIFAGFKAGDNKAGHSKLQLGSFVLDALGQRWAVDLGSDNYGLPGYFEDRRWTYYRMRTEGNNTLTLDGQNQDPSALARLMAVGSTPSAGFAVADLTAAYAVSGGTRVRRGIALVDNRSRVIVRDEIEAARPVDIVWGMHTRAEIQVQGDVAMLTQGGAAMELRLLSPAGARFEVQTVTIAPPQAAAPGVRKLVVRLPEKTAAATITVVFTPGGGKPPPSVAPLADWGNSGPTRTSTMP